MAKKKIVRVTKKAKTDRFAMNRVPKGTAFSVSSKDLLDSKKNPGLKLSAKAVLKNPKISKTEIREKKVTKRELCVKYHAEGMTNEEIAKAAGTTLNSVRWYLNKAGLKSIRATKEKAEA